VRRYTVRYVHKIAPRDTDIGDPVVLAEGAASDSKTLGRALRRAGVLCSGIRLRSFRVEGSTILAFPDRGVWHLVVLTDMGLVS
jgi:hypothetical protein